jgi:hypothetical protein
VTPPEAVPAQAPPSEAAPAQDAAPQPAAPPSAASAAATTSVAASAAPTPDVGDSEQAEAPTHHLELGASLSGTWMRRPLALDAGVVSDRVVGYGANISLAYRGPFFLYPFIEVGFYDLASSTIHPVTSLNISADEVENSLSVQTYTVGPGVDVGALRVRASVGIVSNAVSSKGPDFDDERSAVGFVNSLFVSAFLLRTPGFRLGAEARVSYMAYSSTTFIAIGVSGAGDMLSW